MFEKYNRVVLGIDPGSLNFGYSILRQDGSANSLLVKGILKMQTITDQIDKNKKVFSLLQELHNTYLFDEIAIEQPIFAKDPQAMLKLGRILGCCIGFAVSKNIPIIEYPPKSVKRVITGNGNAAKQQVAYMLSKILNINMESKTYDDTDAVAVSLCHILNNSGNPIVSSKKSWTNFIKENPDRIV